MTEKKYEDMTDQEKTAFKANKVYHDAKGKAYQTSAKGKPTRVPEFDIDLSGMTPEQIKEAKENREKVLKKERIVKQIKDMTLDKIDSHFKSLSLEETELELDEITERMNQEREED